MLLAMDEHGHLVDARVLSKKPKTSASKKKCAMQRESYFCPGCGEPVVLRQGAIMIAHFAHGKNSCCQMFSEGESAEHIAGKSLLLRFFPTAELEVYLPDLAQRPDVLCGKVAFEFQCSALSYQRFIERTSNYLRQGYRPVWIAGARFQPRGKWSTFQKALCQYRKDLGFYCYGLDVATNTLLRYQHLSWSYERGYQWQTIARRLISPSDGAKARLDQCPSESLPIYSVKKESLIMEKREVDRSAQLSDWMVIDEYEEHAKPLLSYREKLQKELMRKDPGTLGLQQVIYEYGYSLFDLPDWCYIQSKLGAFFRDQILVFRVFYLIDSDYDRWLSACQNAMAEWQFPLLSESVIYRVCYQECVELSEDCK